MLVQPAAPSVDKSYLLSVEYSCGDTNSDPQEVIYFQNRNFPESATDPEICLFTVKIKDNSICQLRS